MINALKYIVVFSSFLISLFVNHSDKSNVSFSLLIDIENDSPRSQILSSSYNLFCILNKNESITSYNNLNVRTNTSKYLIDFKNIYTFVKPRYSAFLIISEKKQFVNYFFRQLLFPFHFFF